MTEAGTSVLFLSYAAERTGPPILLLHLLRWLTANTPLRTHVLLLTGGELEASFREISPVTVLDEHHPPVAGAIAASVASRLGQDQRARRMLRTSVARRLPRLDDFDVVYVNTAASVRGLRYLEESGARVISHIHELDVGLHFHLPPEDRELLREETDQFVFASEAVREAAVDALDAGSRPGTVVHEFVDTEVDRSPATSAALRHRLGIDDTTPVVGSVGVPSWRKAPDLFVHVAREVDRRCGELRPHFVWVGGTPDDPALRAARCDADEVGLADRFHVVPHEAEAAGWSHAFDVFALTAREDAFPLACLEAAAVSVPVVCFDRGGMPEFVEDGTSGYVVTYPDVAGYADRVAQLLQDAVLRGRFGHEAQRRVRREHGIESASRRIHDLIVSPP